MKIYIFLILILSVVSCTKETKNLPVYGRKEVTEKVINNHVIIDTINHTVKNFSFYNQDSIEVTGDTFNNSIYVADFFFTTCPSICPKMTANMGLIQEAIRYDDQIQLVSFSVTPQIDTVAQLKRYAIEKGVLDSKWNLLTGDKKLIYNLARKSFLAAKNDGDGGPQDMIHTENFVLVDPDKRIRGFYDGTSTLAMKKLLLDIKILQKEFSFP